MRVTILGLGAMGRRMAAKVAEAGHAVTVWNRTPATADALTAGEDGMVAAPSAAAAVVDAEIAIAMLADDDASRAVWVEGGALDAMPPDAVVADASTLSVAWSAELASRAHDAGVDFAAVPVVGSRPQAEAGALLSIAGGSAEAIDRLRPVLEAYSGRVHVVPGAADAALLKLLVNGLFAAQAALFGEVAGMVERSTLPTEETFELVAGLPITAPGLARIVGLYPDRRFDPNFPVSLVAKDLGYLERAAADAGAETPIVAAASTVFTAGVDEALGDLDVSGIATRYLP